jgi:hypothetical protein
MSADIKIIVLVFFLSFSLYAGEKISGIPEVSLPPHSLFGYSVSCDGEFAAVSAPGETYDNLISAGAVYLYRLKNNEWKFFQKIIPSDPALMKMFGQSIKLSGYTLLIGAPEDNIKTGAVYVYKFDGKWNEIKKITSPDKKQFTGFGTSVDYKNGTALITSIGNQKNISASGNVYVYNGSDDDFLLDAVVSSPEENNDDLFGASALIISKTHIVVSSPRANGSINNCGIVYSYIKQDSEWELNQSLYSQKLMSDGLFGSSISYSEHRLLIGAMQEEVDSIISGAAYLFHLHEDDKWIIEKKFTPDNKRNHDYFGMATFINKEILVLGSPKWDIDKLNRNGDMGSADVYSLSDSGWIAAGKIIPQDGASDDHFGMAIGSFENTLLIGARLNDNDAFNNGSAYFYKFSELFPSLAPKFIPEAFELYHNFPNPFNALTTIRYDLPINTNVNMTVYDILGRKIIELVNGEEEAGRKQIIWNGNNANGIPSSSGVYIYRIKTTKFNNTKKMILLK